MQELLLPQVLQLEDSQELEYRAKVSRSNKRMKRISYNWSQVTVVMMKHGSQTVLQAETSIIQFINQVRTDPQCLLTLDHTLV